jgi:integrase
MGRPKEAIKAQRITGSDRYRIIFAEHPEWIFNTRFDDPDEAKKCGKKIKAELFASRQSETLSLRALSEGLFDEGSAWRKDQESSGFHRIPKMYEIYSRLLENHILPALGNKNAATLLGKDIKTAVNGFVSSVGKPLARATKNRCLWILNMMYTWWISQGILKTNPIEFVAKYNEAPEAPRGAIPRDDRAKMFPKDVEALIEFWGSTMWAAFFSIMNDTGARNGEPRALKWCDINLEKEFIPLMKAVQGGTTETIKGTKNAKMKPGWPTKTTIEAIKLWKKRNTISSGYRLDLHLFQSRDG